MTIMCLRLGRRAGLKREPWQLPWWMRPHRDPRVEIGRQAQRPSARPTCRGLQATRETLPGLRHGPEWVACWAWPEYLGARASATAVSVKLASGSSASCCRRAAAAVRGRRHRRPLKWEVAPVGSGPPWWGSAVPVEMGGVWEPDDDRQGVAWHGLFEPLEPAETVSALRWVDPRNQKRRPAWACCCLGALLPGSSQQFPWGCRSCSRGVGLQALLVESTAATDAWSPG